MLVYLWELALVTRVVTRGRRWVKERLFASISHLKKVFNYDYRFICAVFITFLDDNVWSKGKGTTVN